MTSHAARRYLFGTSLSTGPTLPSVDQQRMATVSKLQRVMTAAQTNNPRDIAPLGIVPVSSLAPSLTNEVTYQNNPGVFEVLGGVPFVTTDPAMFIVGQADDTPNNNSSTAAFMPNSQPVWQYAGKWNISIANTRYIEVVTRENASPLMRVWVNGRLAHATRAGYAPNPGGSGLVYTKYDLGAVGTYEIAVEMHTSMRFKGIRADTGAIFSKPTRADTVTMAVFGDSYSAGVANNSLRGDDLMNNLAQYLGVKSSVTAAIAGSALAITSNLIKMIPQFYSDFVVPNLKPAIDPDIIVIAAGYNDTESAGISTPAAYAFWQQVRADFPRALIVVVGMWGGVIQVRTTLQNREEAFRAQFNTWADPFSIFVRSVYAPGSAGDFGWQIGTGYVGTPKYDGINDYILYSDRNHPTDGYDQFNGNWYMSTKARDAVIEGINNLGATYNPAGTQIPRWPLSLKLADPSGAPPAATLNAPYLLATMATGGAVARTFSMKAGSPALPTGLTLNPRAGHWTGTPTAAGTYGPWTLTVTDGVTSTDLTIPPITVS
ncbi:GDSL-type esterase/lipase family protein [Sphingomonas nostoxanthinifaciens]|uniref:GDSL-type esterase/lipase family protein n=1 Tax=Sphingomonas nostoxanthinifaciens TaxID=2872652 RepID=UPI001CC20406|nr:GDSL-type esterase/lipase family protein [Sphingomonas nostoxanthinifaciens]UAK24174.1 putative Ig domain-containing protein [Sphingomonas nostoxanthinifaciens]